MLEPAHRAGLVVEPGLVDLLLREVEGEAGALPMLSHALRETWRRREGRSLTVAAYLESGGVRGAVEQTAEAVYADIDAEPQVVDAQPDAASGAAGRRRVSRCGRACLDAM